MANDHDPTGFGLDRPKTEVIPEVESPSPSAKTDVKVPTTYHKSFEGPSKDIDRLSYARKMARRMDIAADQGGLEGLRKRRRVLADGTTLTYRGGMGLANSPVGKVGATVPPRERVLQEAWERHVKELIETMDDPEARATIQPAYLVWDDPGDFDAEPCGMLITNKFGPPYYYLPRVTTQGMSGEEVTVFTLSEPPGNKGGGYDYTLGSAARHLKTTYVNFWAGTQTVGTTYIDKSLGRVYRAAAGEFQHEMDDLEEDFHGQPEESRGLQAIVNYHMTPFFHYSWYSCQAEQVIGIDPNFIFQRTAVNFMGDDWLSKGGGGIAWYWREDEFNRGYRQESRVFFDGDCGHIEVEEDEAHFDAAYLGVNMVNLFMVGYSFEWCGVGMYDILPGTQVTIKFTIEWCLNHWFEDGDVGGPIGDDEEEWPYPIRGYPFGGGGFYQTRSCATTYNLWQSNTYYDHDIGRGGNTPYYYRWGALPVDLNCRDNCHTWCACPLFLGKEWLFEGADVETSIGQVLLDASDKPTQEWVAFVAKNLLGDCYWDHATLDNGFDDIWIRNSRGYEQYLGKSGNPSMRATYAMNAAAIWDVRSKRQAGRGGPLKAVEVWEFSKQDGTDDQATEYPEFLGPIKMWGDGHYGGGRRGPGCEGGPGDTFELSGEDSYEIGFIIIGRTFQPQPNPSAPSMTIEGGGSSAVCWRRKITPDLITIDEENERRHLWYSFAEEQAGGHWPPTTMLSGSREDWPENAHFRKGVLPVKIYHRPRNWLRTTLHPGKTEDTHGIVTRVEPE
jgi:hypothetical protein